MSARGRRTSVQVATDKDKLIEQLKKELKQLESKLTKSSGAKNVDVSSLRIKLSAAQKENAKLQQTITELQTASASKSSSSSSSSSSSGGPTKRSKSRTKTTTTPSAPSTPRKKSVGGRSTKAAGSRRSTDSSTIKRSGSSTSTTANDDGPTSPAPSESGSSTSGGRRKPNVLRSTAASRAHMLKPPTGRPTSSTTSSSSSSSLSSTVKRGVVVAKTSSRRALAKPEISHPTARRRPSPRAADTVRKTGGSSSSRSRDKLEQERDAARAEAQSLKEEIVRMANQLKETMSASNDDLLQQIEQLQQDLEAAERRNRAAKVVTADGQSLEAKIIDLQQCLVALQRENDLLKRGAGAGAGAGGAGGVGGVTAAAASSASMELDHRIEELQQIVLDYQERCENQQAKIKQLMRERPRQQAGTQRLSDNVTNLTYHIFYGAADKDRQLEELTKKVEAVETDAAYVERIRKKYGKMRDKMVEEWLFSEALSEAL